MPPLDDRCDNDPHDEKADALLKLAELIERIVNPPADNVVALADRKAAR